jgi:predicted choloylglycine hydrolase
VQCADEENRGFILETCDTREEAIACIDDIEESTAEEGICTQGNYVIVEVQD